MIVELVFTVVLHGVTFTHEGGQVEIEVCEAIAAAPRIYDWQASCKRLPDITGDTNWQGTVTIVPDPVTLPSQPAPWMKEK